MPAFLDSLVSKLSPIWFLGDFVHVFPQTHFNCNAINRLGSQSIVPKPGTLDNHWARLHDLTIDCENRYKLLRFCIFQRNILHAAGFFQRAVNLFAVGTTFGQSNKLCLYAFKKRTKRVCSRQNPHKGAIRVSQTNTKMQFRKVEYENWAFPVRFPWGVIWLELSTLSLCLIHICAQSISNANLRKVFPEFIACKGYAVQCSYDLWSSNEKEHHPKRDSWLWEMHLEKQET